MRAVALTALLVLSTVLLPGVHAQELPVDGEMHCGLPTTMECIDEWVRMLKDPWAFRTWFCNFVTGGTDPRCF